MILRFAALTVAGFGLIFIAANPTEVPPTSTASSSLTSPSNLASTTEEALSLSIDYDAAKKSFQLSFEATDREQYYLLEGRGSLTQGDWQVGYGIKGTGIPMTTPMGADSDKGFYRLSRTGSDDDRLQVDFDGDRVVLLDELDRGLAGFEEELADDDKDLIPNDFEVVNGLNPADATDASGDVDGDGVSNANEYKLGDDPNREEADRFTMSINMKYEVQYYFQSEINVVEFSALYSNKHETGEAHTTGHQSRYLLPNVEGGYEWNIDAKTWVQFSFCFYHKERTDPYLEIEKSRGYYQILSCIGSPITFLIQQTQYTYVEGSRGRRWTKPTENTEKSYEVVHWNGKELTIDGEPVSLPTGERGCKYRYGLVRLPYRVDLDILHPATGKLEENLEDKDHDSEGGYVALKREIDGEDVAPVTQLRFSSSSPYEMKYRLKFDSGGRYRIYKDADRTEEVFTEDTEFPAGTATTVYLQGLKKSDASGGEKVTLQISLDDTWFDTDSVDFTVVQSEFEIVHRVFIPYNWVDIPLHPFHPKQVAEGDDRGFDPGLTGTYRVEQRAVLCPYRDLDASPVKDKEKRAGITRHFDESNVSNHSGALHSGLEPQQPSRIQKDSVPLNTGIASLGNVRAYLLASPVDHQTHLRMEGSAAEPIVMGAGLVAPIDWLFDIAIGVGNPAEPQVILSGEHDGFPAYEIYVYAGRDKSSPTTVLQWLPPIESGVLALAGNDPDTPVEERTKPIEQ